MYTNGIWLLYLHMNPIVWDRTQPHKLDFLEWFLVWGYIAELTFLHEFLMGIKVFRHINFQLEKSEMFQGWGRVWLWIGSSVTKYVLKVDQYIMQP